MGMEPNNTEYKRKEDGTFTVGTAPGPGRPKGKTMKEFAREFLMNMDDEQKLAWLKGLSDETIWKMAEGNPHQTSDITSGDKPIPIIPLNAVLDNDSDNQDTKAV